MAGFPDIIAELPAIAGPGSSRSASWERSRSGMSFANSHSSSFVVLAVETRASTPVSRPNAIASAPTTTAPPSARRIHSSAPSERFIAANTLPPSSSAAPSDTAVPNAYASSSSDVSTFAPRSAAPVRIKPRIGPAQGAQSMPVAAPSKSDEPGLPSTRAEELSLLPSATTGRVMRFARPGSSSARPNTSTSASAIQRPH